MTAQVQVTDLAAVKPLTNSEYEAARNEAIKRIRQRAGDKPRRKDYQKDHAPLWGPLDLAALLVLLSAWLVSSAHILTHIGRAAYNSYQQVDPGVYAGWLWDSAWFGYVHQAGYIILAEAAMILFMTMFAAMRRDPDESGPAYYTRKTIPLALALGSALFAVIANWQSGVGELESVLPPAVTIGLGYWLEGKIAAMIARQAEVTEAYNRAYERYILAQQEPEQHPDFGKFLNQAIAQRLARKSGNRDLEIPLPVLRQAVAREKLRETWAAEDDSAILAQVRAMQVNPTPAGQAMQPALTASGNGHNGRH